MKVDVIEETPLPEPGNLTDRYCVRCIHYRRGSSGYDYAHGCTYPIKNLVTGENELRRDCERMRKPDGYPSFNCGPEGRYWTPVPDEREDVGAVSTAEVRQMFNPSVPTETLEDVIDRKQRELRVDDEQFEVEHPGVLDRMRRFLRSPR